MKKSYERLQRIEVSLNCNKRNIERCKNKINNLMKEKNRIMGVRRYEKKI